MSLQTFVLSDQTASLPVGPLLQQAAAGGLEVRDTDGNIVALVMSPRDLEAITYLEGYLDFEQHREDIKAALARRDGITTDELLRRAATASKAVQQ